MKHRPRKRFGQNFLQDQYVIEKIIQTFHPQRTDSVVEIGPGLGALTQALLPCLEQLIAIEIDRDLQTHLQILPMAREKLIVIQADALMIDYSQWGKHIRIIGNLPYNISTPLLVRLLHYAHTIEDMHFMLQKEVVERLVATPGNKTYGRLSVIAQYFCEVEHVLDVPASAFYPQPKVESAVIRLTPYCRDQSPYEMVPFRVLERLVAQAFSMRRKTLANNLKPLLTAAMLNDLGIDARLRPEQISIADYVKMALAMMQYYNEKGDNFV